MARFSELCKHLSQAGVEWISLDVSDARLAENRWREVYGEAFAHRPRLKQGAKADYAYSLEVCDQYSIIPFTSGVRGLPLGDTRHPPEAGCECRGRPIPLGRFHWIEFFVCPVDHAWTMVYTHEDYDGWGGPYFMRQEWIS